MSRGRVFSAGSKVLTTIARAQAGIPSKLEQVPMTGVFLVERALGARAHGFCRPFSVGTQTLSLENEFQSKSDGLLTDCDENPDVRKYFIPFCNESTLPLVHKAIKVMQPGVARELFKLAAITQEPAKFTRYLYNLLFRTFLHANTFDTALEVLEEMKKSEVLVNFKSFATLAFFYVKAGMKSEAEETLDLMNSYGFSKKKDVYRVLFREYIEAGDDEGVERLLLRCSEAREVESALRVLAELGKTKETLSLLARMDAEGIDASKSTDLAVTKCLCNANMIDEALKYVEKVQAKGVLPSTKLFNILISSLVREKRLDEVLKLVSNMRDIGRMPNKKTHHLLISGFLNSGDTEKAHMHLEEMKRDGCRPTLETLKLFEGFLDKIELAELGEGEGVEDDALEKEILEICEGKLWSAQCEEALAGISKDLTNKLVKKVLQKIEFDNIKQFFTWAGNQAGYSHGRHEYRALIRRFMRAGMLDKAMEFHEEMWEKDVKILPDDFAKIVYHSGKAGKMTKANEAVDMMKCYGMNPDAKLYGAFLSGHLEANDDKGVASIVEKLSHVEEFNAAISTFARAEKADDALRMLEIMEEKGCKSSVQTYDLLVRCLCGADRIEEALKALENMRGKGLVPDVKIYNILINYCSQHKKLDEALKLFSEMKEAGCSPDISTHHSLISGYLRARQAEKAHQHVELMKAEGCMPTRETSRLFVVNLSMIEELDRALKEFYSTAEKGKMLSTDACNCLLKALMKAGKLDTAVKVYETMKGSADMSTYVVMLRGCCNLSKFDVIEQLLGEVRMKNIQLPVSTYVVLLQTYSRAKINKKVASMFEELQNSGQSLDGPRINTAVLDALSRGHQLDTGVKFCKHLVDNGGKINSRQLKHFFRLLIRSGRAGEATELSKELAKKGCVIPEKSEMQEA